MSHVRMSTLVRAARFLIKNKKVGGVVASAFFAFVLVAVPSSVFAAITFQTVQTGSGSGSVTITKPTGTVAGDFLIAGLVVDSGSGTSVTAPSGWTLILRTDDNDSGIGDSVGDDVSILTYSKVAGASEPANYTWTTSSSRPASGGIIRYTGVDTTNPIDVSLGANGSGSTASAPSVTTSTTNTQVMVFFGADNDVSFAQPSGTTERYDVPLNASNDVGSAADDFTQASVGVTGAKTSSMGSTESWVAITIALKPAALSNQTITVSTHAPASATYGDTFPVAATASSGLAVAMTTTGGCSIAAGTVTMTSGTTACVVHFNQAGNGSYNAAPEVIETTTAQKKAITVTADDKSKIEGQSDPILTYQLTSGSLVGTDSFSGALTRTAGESIGTYPITQGGLSIPITNYALTFVPGTLTISTACPTVAGNLISNRCLEDGIDIPTGWNTSSFGTNTFTPLWTLSGGHNGTKGGQITISSYTDGAAEWFFNDVNVIPGQLYSFSDWYTSTAPGAIDVRFKVANANATVDCDVADSAGLGFAYCYSGLTSNLPSTGGVWQEFHTDIIPPPGTQSFTVFHSIAGIGSLTVDDYSLVAGAADAYPIGMVSLTFDDGWKSIYDNARSVLNSHNLKSTQFIYTSAVNGGFPDYMSWSDIATMMNEGHEIGDHTRNHVSLAATSTAVLNFEVDGARLDLAAGLSTTTAAFQTLAYPYGEYDANVKNHLQSVSSPAFIGARSVDQGYNFENTDKYALKIQHVTNLTTFNDVKNWIDTANLNKAWLILMFHKVIPGGDMSQCAGDEECITHDLLEQIAAYLADNHVCVLTMAQGLETIPPCNHVPALDPVADQTVVVNNALTFTAHATDADAGDTLVYSLVGAPTGTSINSSTGVFSWTPLNSDLAGSPYTFSVSVNDGHGGVASTVVHVVVNPDIIPPTPTLATTATNPTNLALIPITATFSEAVTGFDLSDLSGVAVTNGTAGDFVAVDPSHYIFNITPTTDDDVVVTIAATAAQDTALVPNQSTVSNALTVNSDRSKPTITLLGDAVIATTTQATAYTDQGATASDVHDGDLTSHIVMTGSVNLATPGSYILTYNVSDAAGNAADSVTRTINVSDATAPVITVPTTIVVEATGPTGAIVTYTLPTGHDDVDPTVVVLCTPASDTLFAIGTTTVFCSAVDSAGNTGTASFKVAVTDTTAPGITAPANQTFEAVGPLTWPTGVVLPTVTDAVDSAATITHDPLSLPLGTTTVTWVATDAMGNISASVTSDIGIIDTTAPTIDLHGGATTDITVGGTFTDPTTASDLVDGDLTALMITVGTVDTATVGTYTVDYSATDSHGNMSATTTRTVVISNPPPAPTISSGGGGGGGGVVLGLIGTINTNPQTGAPVVPTTPPVGGQVLGAQTSTCVIFTQTLMMGSTGSEVTQLQNTLTALGFYTGPTTGYFGPMTQTAVKKFQEAKGIDAVGVVGPKTRAALNACELGATTPTNPSSNSGSVLGASTYHFTLTLKRGDSGVEVTELQKVLIAQGFLKLDAPTGFFGSQTKEAVMAYQTAHGLPAVGIVGPLTRAELNK